MCAMSIQSHLWQVTTYIGLYQLPISSSLHRVVELFQPAAYCGYSMCLFCDCCAFAAVSVRRDLAPSGMPHHVSGINFLVPSVNLIPVPLSLTCMMILLPHLLTLSTHHCRHPYLTLSFTPDSRPTSFTNLSHHWLPSSLRTDSADFITEPFLLSISFFLFLVSPLLFFLFGFVRKIKLAVQQLFGAH